MLDWTIHKKLLDAGGLGPVVYILIPRTNRNLAAEHARYLELLAAGRTVRYIRPGDPKRLQGSRKQWLLRDRDILSPEAYERAERIWNEVWKNERNSRYYKERKR